MLHKNRDLSDKVIQSKPLQNQPLAQKRPIQAKQRPIKAKHQSLQRNTSTLPGNDLKTQMGAQYGVDLSGYKEHTNSPFPGSVNALATIQGQDIHYAPGEYNEKNRKHELGHAIDNTLNGTPQGDKVVNGLNVDTSREKIADKIAETPVQRMDNKGTLDAQITGINHIPVKLSPTIQRLKIHPAKTDVKTADLIDHTTFSSYLKQQILPQQFDKIKTFLEAQVHTKVEYKDLLDVESRAKEWNEVLSLQDDSKLDKKPTKDSSLNVSNKTDHKAIENIISKDKLNVVGERHDNTWVEHQEKLLSEEMGLPLWQENNFVYTDEKGQKQVGDSVYLRVMHNMVKLVKDYLTEKQLAPLQHFLEISNDKAHEAFAGGKIKFQNHLGVYNTLNMDQSAGDSILSLLYLTSGNYLKFIEPQYQVMIKAIHPVLINLYATFELVRKMYYEKSSITHIPLDNKFYKPIPSKINPFNDIRKILKVLNKFVDKIGFTDDSLTEKRSRSMHESANQAAQKQGIWKIGESHIRDIKRLIKPEDRHYNLLTEVTQILNNES